MLTDDDVYNTLDILGEAKKQATQEGFEDMDKSLGDGSCAWVVAYSC